MRNSSPSKAKERSTGPRLEVPARMRGVDPPRCQYGFGDGAVLPLRPPARAGVSSHSSCGADRSGVDSSQLLPPRRSLGGRSEPRPRSSPLPDDRRSRSQSFRCRSPLLSLSLPSDLSSRPLSPSLRCSRRRSSDPRSRSLPRSRRSCRSWSVRAVSPSRRCSLSRALISCLALSFTPPGAGSKAHQ